MEDNLIDGTHVIESVCRQEADHLGVTITNNLLDNTKNVTIAGGNSSVVNCKNWVEVYYVIKGVELVNNNGGTV